MKNLNNNRGVTLVELVVSLAILALLGGAVVGIMSNNTIIFRKNKADLTVQNTAEEVYNTLSEDIMQAQYVYIEGYKAASNDAIEFNPNYATVKEKDAHKYSGSLTPIKMLRQSDINIIKEFASSSTCEAYLNSIFGVSNRESVANAIRAGLSDQEKKDKFDSFYNRLRYMENYEIERYGKFLDDMKLNTFAGTTYTAFDSADVKSGDVYNDIYIKKIVLQYSVPIDTKYVSDTTKIKTYTYQKNGVEYTENADDYCRVTYTFRGDEMRVVREYGAQDKLNTSTVDDNDLYTTILDYVICEDGTNLSGVVANIDAANDSIKFDMYFAENKRNYNDYGMIYIRNSYVLHDTK